MLTVFLYGHLAEKFGKKHRLAVKSPAEAIRAFCANYPHFRQAVIDGGGYRILAGKEDRANGDGLHIPTSKAIKIVPVVSGASGLGKVLAGAALIGLSFVPGLQAPLFSVTSGFLAGVSVASIAGSIGFSLVLGGISSALFSPSRAGASGNSERPENRPSYNFNGAINTTGQGGPVPLCYGRLRVGSQLISAGTETANL